MDLCFVCIIERNRSKFDLRAKKCIFLGYKSGIEGYIILDIKSREVFVTRNIRIYDHVSPFMKNHESDRGKFEWKQLQLSSRTCSNQFAISERNCNAIDNNQNPQNMNGPVEI